MIAAREWIALASTGGATKVLTVSDACNEYVAFIRVSDLQARLAAAHGVTVLSSQGSDVLMRKREFAAPSKRSWLPDSTTTGQRAFQMAAQIGLLEESATIESLVDRANLSSDAARDGLGLALSNYFAGTC